MKILLTAINAKYIHSNLAVYSLKAYARRFQESIEIKEFTINHRSESILQEIYKKKPDVLCFSCYIWNYVYVREIASEFHKLMPQVPIWAGGPEVSYEIAGTFRENPAFYGVMVGEGEASFLELAEYYCNRKPNKSHVQDDMKSLKDIKGIAYRKNGYGFEEIEITGEREPLDLSSLPFCYENMDDFKNRIIYYESSRGCPYRCSYCLSSVEKSLRFRDILLVKKELAFFMEQKVPQVKFVDRTFNCNHNHAMEIWRFIKEKDNGTTNFHFEIAADILTEEEIELLSSMRPGLVQLEIGVQTTYEKTIEEIRRNMSLSDVKEKVRQIQKGDNIHIHLDLIAGLPYEGYERFQESFRDIYKLKPHELQLGFLKVLKGSYIFEKKEKYGMIYKSLPPYEVMETKWISYEEVLKIKLVEEMLERYYNSGQFEVTMKCLDVVYPDSFGFFLKLGEYYEEKGYLSMNHSRIRQCEILLEFLEGEGKISMEFIRQSLVFDLYYRENLKSRPHFAGPPLPSRIAREYCKKGSLSHVEPFSYHFPGKEEKSLQKLPRRLEEEVYVLFEYDRRDVLSHQAKITELKICPRAR